MNPKLKPPATERLNPVCSDSLSSFAVNFNSRHHILEQIITHQKNLKRNVMDTFVKQLLLSHRQGLTLVYFSAQRKRFLWDRGCVQVLFRGG